MKNLELPSPAEMGAAARAAEITAIVAAAIVRRCVDEAKKQRTVGVGFVPDQRVHATPYQSERLR